MCLKYPGWNVLFFLSLCAVPLSAETNPPEVRVDFEREIRPLLADRCFHCHGPDAQQRQGDLRLDEEQAALADTL